MRGGEVEEAGAASAAERTALRAFRRRLQTAGGEVGRLASVSPEGWWVEAPAVAQRLRVLG